MSNNYISRRMFQEYSDFHFSNSINNLQWSATEIANFNPNCVKLGDTIFVRGLSINHFFENVHPQIKFPYVLITHVDDNSLPGELLKYINSPKLLAWFTINPSITYHPKIISLPIGVLQFPEIHNRRKEINSLFTYVRRSVQKNKLLYMNFKIWYPEHPRAFIHKIFSSTSFCTVSQDKPFKEYITEMGQHKFVLSPPGIGIDCYRTWEALLVGTIPIVEKSHLSSLYAGLPVLVIDKWENITEEFLNQKYIEITAKNYSLKKLYMEYWLNKIKAYSKISRL